MVLEYEPPESSFLRLFANSLRYDAQPLQKVEAFVPGEAHGANLARSSGDDNQNHVGRNQQASSKELPPMFPAWRQLKEPGQANDDEQEMGHAANQDQ